MAFLALVSLAKIPRLTTRHNLQGSTYVYVAHMHPFLTAHESEIDGAIADAKDRAKQAGLEWIGRVVQKARELVMGAAVVSGSSELSSATADRLKPHRNRLRQTLKVNLSKRVLKVQRHPTLPPRRQVWSTWLATTCDNTVRRRSQRGPSSCIR